MWNYFLFFAFSVLRGNPARPCAFGYFTWQLDERKIALALAWSYYGPKLLREWYAASLFSQGSYGCPAEVHDLARRLLVRAGYDTQAAGLKLGSNSSHARDGGGVLVQFSKELGALMFRVDELGDFIPQLTPELRWAFGHSGYWDLVYEYVNFLCEQEGDPVYLFRAITNQELIGSASEEAPTAE